jgi:hypothetical protein
MWHEFWEPIVIAVVSSGVTLFCWVCKRIFSAFVSLALARENAQDERLNRLEAWRLRTDAPTEKVNGQASSGDDDSPGSGRSSPRIRRRNME